MWGCQWCPRQLRENEAMPLAIPHSVLRVQPSPWVAPHRHATHMHTVVTPQVIVLQGIVGSTPWNAMVFFTLWLQLLGFSDLTAAVLMAVFATGAALGGLLGGFVGDHLARWSPNHGRTLAAQISVAAGLPLSALVLKGLPRDDVSASGVGFLYGSVLFVFGLCISWAAPACNSPMFAEIVPEHMRSTIYAFDRSFEGAIAAR